MWAWRLGLHCLATMCPSSRWTWICSGTSPNSFWHRVQNSFRSDKVVVSLMTATPSLSGMAFFWSLRPVCFFTSCWMHFSSAARLCPV
ncbi:hypothetical protein EVA_10765 [gut metagenome]|uniref:Uncharacterized protein n=1 Tax=gut metagenome TaxID=749906 RepID=J9CM09_9ZZZZ